MLDPHCGSTASNFGSNNLSIPINRRRLCKMVGWVRKCTVHLCGPTVFSQINELLTGPISDRNTPKATQMVISSSASDHSMGADQAHVCTGPVLLKLTRFLFLFCWTHTGHISGVISDTFTIWIITLSCTCAGRAELLKNSELFAGKNVCLLETLR